MDYFFFATNLQISLIFTLRTQWQVSLAICLNIIREIKAEDDFQRLEFLEFVNSWRKKIKKQNP